MTKHASILSLLLAIAFVIHAAAEEHVDQHVLENVPEDLMLRYFHEQAKNLSSQHQGSKSFAAWQTRREQLRTQIWNSLGNFPLSDRPPVKAHITGTIDHGDHNVEKVVYESLPGLYVTALAYVPKGLKEPAPAVICVNGHWSEAKTTPIIQRRCIMLARMGVVAFCQDVIGTGERAAFQGSEPTTYHGFYRGATPRIVDRSLLGYIMYECIRANDYLHSRADVDPNRIICTGASGGGKQSMFFPALDDRLAGGVPVCYLSSYVDHIGATACVGEVPIGVLRYTDQWEILGLHSPRPLLCLAASRDVPVFLPKPALQTLEKVKTRVYQLYDQQHQVRFSEFDSKHDYNQPMRERLYSHVAEYLLQQPDKIIVEPEDLPIETAETLRCGLPAKSESMRSLTFRRAQELVSAYPKPTDRQQWQKNKNAIKEKLEHEILGGFLSRDLLKTKKVRDIQHKNYREQHWILETEPGVPVPSILCLPKRPKRYAVIIVDEVGKQNALQRGLVKRLIDRGHPVLAIDYRGTGETAGTVPAILYGPGTPEYNLSNYALFLGRPLMGMRMHDLRTAIDFLQQHDELKAKQVAVVGRGRGAMVALLAAIFDQRINAVVGEELLASWVFAEEFVDIGLSSLIPKILTVADVDQLTACLAPRKLLLINPVDGRNRKLTADRVNDSCTFTQKTYQLSSSVEKFKVTVANDQILEKIANWLE